MALGSCDAVIISVPPKFTPDTVEAISPEKVFVKSQRLLIIKNYLS